MSFDWISSDTHIPMYTYNITPIQEPLYAAIGVWSGSSVTLVN